MDHCCLWFEYINAFGRTQIGLIPGGGVSMHISINNYSRSDNPCCEYILGMVRYSFEGIHLTYHHRQNKIKGSDQPADFNLGINVHLHRQKNAHPLQRCVFII